MADMLLRRVESQDIDAILNEIDEDETAGNEDCQALRLQGREWRSWRRLPVDCQS